MLVSAFLVNIDLCHFCYRKICNNWLVFSNKVMVFLPPSSPWLLLSLEKFAGDPSVVLNLLFLVYYD